MSRPLLILRPEPGASATAARAWALGLTPIIAPLFAYRALAWASPDPADFDALLLTSAAAPRLAGEGLARFHNLPAYAVGEATATAARETGLTDVHEGTGDADALVEQAAAAGHRRLLHLCGIYRRAVARDGVSIFAIPVYSAERLPTPANLAASLRDAPVALIHSPRAGRAFAALVEDRARVSIAAISLAAASSVGEGWRAVHVAAAPTDDAVLAVAASLCETGGEGQGQ